MRSLKSEIIRQFVNDEGSKQNIDIDIPRFVFPKNIADFKTSYSLSTRNMVTIGMNIVIQFKFISS
jgi:hypothetical protein